MNLKHLKLGKKVFMFLYKIITGLDKQDLRVEQKIYTAKNRMMCTPTRNIIIVVKWKIDMLTCTKWMILI
jgi:hypothetical protein